MDFRIAIKCCLDPTLVVFVISSELDQQSTAEELPNGDAISCRAGNWREIPKINTVWSTVHRSRFDRALDLEEISTTSMVVDDLAGFHFPNILNSFSITKLVLLMSRMGVP